MPASLEDKIFKALDGFCIELPSWGFANTGTRFGKFQQAAAATSTDEKFSDAGQVHRFATAWGFAEILPDRVTVLAETVEPAEQIDVTRAQQDLAKAEDELKSAQSEEEVSNDLGKVRRAQARIEVAEAKRS